MKLANREALEKYRTMYTSQSGSVNCQEIANIIRDEWDSNYPVNCYCQACVFKMLEYAFTHADNDKTDTITINFE